MPATRATPTATRTRRTAARSILSKATSCGSCNAVCPAATPVCAPAGASFQCATGCADGRASPLRERVRIAGHELEPLRRLQREVRRRRARGGRVRRQQVHVHLQGELPRVRRQVRGRHRSDRVRAELHAVPGAGERSRDLSGERVRLPVRGRVRRLQRQGFGRLRVEPSRPIRRTAARAASRATAAPARRASARRQPTRRRDPEARSALSDAARAAARPASRRTTTCAADGAARTHRGSRAGCSARS